MASLAGKKAPAFTLEGNDGKKHCLDDYKGKTVVMFFLPHGQHARLNQRGLWVP